MCPTRHPTRTLPRSNEQQNVNRAAIERLINRVKGVTQSEVRDVLALAQGTVRHHLQCLHRAGRIESVHVGKRTWFVPKHFIEARGGHEAMAVPLARRILAALVANPRGLGTTDLARESQSTARRVRRILGWMENDGIVRSNQAYRPRFRLCPQALCEIGLRDSILEWSDEVSTQHGPELDVLKSQGFASNFEADLECLSTL